MKSVGSGKTILSSSTTVQSEKPEEEFSFGFSRSLSRHSPMRMFCQDRVIFSFSLKFRNNLMCHYFRLDVAVQTKWAVTGRLSSKRKMKF